MTGNSKTSKASKNIGIFGTKGAGKTTFLVSLIHEMYNYSVSDRWEMNITGPSHKFFIEKLKTLEKGEWLQSTREQQDFNFKMVNNSTGETLQLHTADIVGEAFRDTFDPCVEEHREDQLLEFLKNASGYIFVIDPKQVLDPHQKIEEISVYRSLLEHLRELRGLKPKQKFQEPFAFVFSKSDKYGELVRKPQKFFYNKMRALHGKCESSIQNYRVFMVSAVGAVKEREGKEYPVPPIAPQDVFEPFRWVRDRVLKL